MENSTFDLSIRYTWERKDKYTAPLDAYILFMVNHKALDYTHAHAVPVTRFRNSMNIYCETERDLLQLFPSQHIGLRASSATQCISRDRTSN